jgi:hypothetical protein
MKISRLYPYAFRNAAAAVLARSANAAALAPIRLANAAAQLPYGSGETKGVLLLRSQQRCKEVSTSGQTERKEASFSSECKEI